MARAYLNGLGYRLFFEKDKSFPVGYYVRRTSPNEFTFYNLSPKDKLQRLLIESILEYHSAKRVDLTETPEKVAKGAFKEGIYRIEADPKTYKVRQAIRLNNVPRVNGHMPKAILERVSKKGQHIVSIKGKATFTAKLFVPTEGIGLLFPNSKVTGLELKVARGVAKAPNAMDAIEEAYFKADDNTLYL